MIVLSSWRYETILRMVCFGGVDMMDPPSKVRFCSSYSKIHKITFLSLSKNHQISSKIGQNGSPEPKNFFLGYFDMAVSVLILPDSLDSVFGSFFRIS